MLFRWLQRVLTKYPLAVFGVLLALVAAYLSLIRESVLKQRPDLAWAITFGIAAISILGEQLAKVYFENFHKQISGAALRGWRWIFDEHFRLSFFVTLSYPRADITTRLLTQGLRQLADGFRVTLQGENFVQLREADAPITFQVQWTVVREPEGDSELMRVQEAEGYTEVTVSLVQDLTLGYRTGQETIDILVNRYQRIQECLDGIFEVTTEKNIVAEGAWFNHEVPEAAARTIEDRTFGAKIDIVGASVHVRATSPDALRALRSQLGGLQAI